MTTIALWTLGLASLAAILFAALWAAELRAYNRFRSAIEKAKATRPSALPDYPTLQPSSPPPRRRAF